MPIARDSGSVVRYIESITSYYLKQRRKPCSVIDIPPHTRPITFVMFT